MKRHILIAGLVVGTISMVSLSAVDAGGRGRGAGHHRGAGGPGGPGAALDLTDDQKAQMQGLREQFRTQIQELRDAGELSRADVQAFHEQRRTAVEGILTDEQKAQLADLKVEREAARAEKKEARVERRQAFLDELGVSDDQRAQLDALGQAHRADIEALRESGDISREAVQSLREAQREAFQGILTDEQVAQLEEIKAARQAERGDRDGNGHGRRGRRGHRGDHPADGDAADVGDNVDSDPDGTSALTLPTAVEATSWGKLKANAR